MGNQVKLFSRARISPPDLDVKCANSLQDDPFPLMATLQSGVRLLTEEDELCKTDPDICSLGCLSVNKFLHQAKVLKNQFLFPGIRHIHSISKGFLSWQVIFVISHVSILCPTYRYTSKLSLPEKLLIKSLSTTNNSLRCFLLQRGKLFYICPSSALAQLESSDVY